MSTVLINSRDKNLEKTHEQSPICREVTSPATLISLPAGSLAHGKKFCWGEKFG